MTMTMPRTIPRIRWNAERESLRLPPHEALLLAVVEVSVVDPVFERVGVDFIVHPDRTPRSPLSSPPPAKRAPPEQWGSTAETDADVQEIAGGFSAYQHAPGPAFSPEQLDLLGTIFPLLPDTEAARIRYDRWRVTNSEKLLNIFRVSHFAFPFLSMRFVPPCSCRFFQRPRNDEAGAVPELNAYAKKSYKRPSDPSLCPQDDLFFRALQHTRQVAFSSVPLLAEVLPQRMTNAEYALYKKRRLNAIAGLHGLNMVYDDVTKLRYLHWYKQFDASSLWSKISLLPIKKFGDTVLPTDELEAVKLLKECSSNYGVIKQAVSSPCSCALSPVLDVRRLSRLRIPLLRVAAAEAVMRSVGPPVAIDPAFKNPPRPSLTGPRNQRTRETAEAADTRRRNGATLPPARKRRNSVRAVYGSVPFFSFASGSRHGHRRPFTFVFAILASFLSRCFGFARCCGCQVVFLVETLSIACA